MRTGPATSEKAQSWAQDVLREVLAVTCWVDPGPAAEVTVKINGRRPGSAEEFTRLEPVTGIVPGSGPLAVTRLIAGLKAGPWEVTAEVAGQAGPPGAKILQPIRNAPGINAPLNVPPASGRSARRLFADALLRSAQRTTARTPSRTVPPLSVRVPGTIRFAWTALLLAGMLVSLAIEAALLRRNGLAIGTPLAISALAIACGLAGGKGLYIAQHRGRQFDGWSIQGALALGTAAATAALLLTGLGAHAAVYLNFAAPGMLCGMAVGRPGCLLAGCCAGRPTGSRFGVWSSDHRVGMHRIPAQLIEAATTMAIGLAALAAILALGTARPGAVFFGSLAANTLARQFVLPLRAEPGRTAHGRAVTAACAAIALVVVTSLAALD